KSSPAVGSVHRVLGELAANQVRFLVVGVLKRVPHLLLASVVGGDGEGHELLQGHSVFGVDVEELLRHGGKTQPLLHYGRRDKEAAGNLLVASPLVAQRLEGTELIQRM